MFRALVTDELREEPAGRAFRPDRRPLWLAVIANAVLFAVLVVFPYVRGQDRSAEERERFARFAACFWSATAEPSPGLELPPGEHERYASNVLRAEADWPARCREALLAIAPDEVFLLFPGAKQAEAQVREAVALVARELDVLSRAREEGIGAVPVRPHLAVGRLRAALAALHDVTGAELRGNAIRLSGEQALPSPARVPLQASVDAELHMEAEADGVRALAADRRGISLVRVAAGRVDIRRVSRPGLVRGVAEAPDETFLVWAMAQERCADDEHRCAYHATGLAPYPDAGSTAPDPTWYAGHPFGRIDRSLIVREDGVWLVAARAEPPYAELRRFERSPEPGDPRAPGGSGDEAAEPPPVEASESRALEAPATVARPSLEADAGAHGLDEPPGEAVPVVLLLNGETQPPVLWASRGGEGVELWHLEAIDAEPRLLVTIAGERPFLVACGGPEARFVVFGAESAARVVRFDRGAVAIGEPFSLRAREPVTAPIAADDTVKLACDASTLDVAASTGTRELVSVRCDAGGRCEPPHRVATGAGAFDLVREGEHTLVAWTPNASNEVHVARVGDRESRVPAACWDTREGTGFCGAPRLAARNGRIVLATREGSDLLAIETVDGGRTWRPMRGIR